MNIVFISNILTPHQIPLSNSLYRITGGRYKFIETMRKEDSLPIGWDSNGAAYDYVIPYEEVGARPTECRNMINAADVVIYGATAESYVRERLKQKDLTFRYAERIYKKRCKLFENVVRLPLHFWRYGRYSSLYLLCAGAYTAADYARTGTFRNKAYKWGYFPHARKYGDIRQVIATKKTDPISILWCGRMIDWKHPETPVRLAERLQDAGLPFKLDLIGTGTMEDEIRKVVHEKHLDGCVNLLGSMTPEAVRDRMEQSALFLSTSDRGEGWGAVLNEAMNSGCAVLVSHAIGSAPYLIDGENGMLYRDGNFDELYENVIWLMKHLEERKQMGAKAYSTITEQWNAENAANRFVSLARKILEGDRSPTLFESGVCSKAEILPDGWYRKHA